jgi:hypothetical protein
MKQYQSIGKEMSWRKLKVKRGVGHKTQLFDQVVGALFVV